jgi:hypothetical protein
VQLQAGGPEPDAVEPALDDLQRGHLLGDEQHGLAPANGVGDQVGDRLRLAGPRRTLDHQVAAGPGVEQGQGLRAVGVDDQAEVGRVRVPVQRLVLVDCELGLLEAIGQQRPHDRMIAGTAALGPARRVEVAVHQELGEREEAQRDRVALDRPARLISHGRGHRVEVAPDVQFVGLGQLGQDDVELRPQLLGQREVDVRVLAVVPQAEPFAGAGTIQGHRDEDERGTQRYRPGVGLGPGEHPQGQEQGVDALFLQRGPGRVIDRQQPVLQLLGEQVGLELQVGRARRREAWRRVLPGRIHRCRFRVRRGGEEGHRLTLPHQDPDQLRRRFPHDLQAPDAGPVVQQRAAQAEVEQVLAVDLQP